jgi:hypothetical protein
MATPFFFVQFDDTNAATIPYRFYRGSYSP